MLKLSTLTKNQLVTRLSGPGLDIRTGMFTCRIHSALENVADGLHLLYGDYPINDQETFIDFHVTVESPGGLRHWIKPQVVFRSDGYAAFKPLPRGQAFPMLEWGLNWCISNYAHRYLMIHAAVVERGGHAAILPAPPGSGKSTLCAALVNRGWRLLSDEIALLSMEDGSVIPVPRPISLKNRSIDVIREFVPDSILSPGVNDTAKGTVAHMKPPQDSVDRAHVTARPAWIIFPRYVAGARSKWSELSPATAFMQVAGNSFNYSLLGQPAFAALVNLIEQTACFDYEYGLLEEAIEDFAGLSVGAGWKA
ncbi:Hpr(Ser) kinase/phosphatase [Noviherbaspirillum humi]|uniref:Hpr(Ser) kinase/phosphatase n=1 Tax=Noviherbaspirillum humi TaxID=1688639 RepID=A0A239HJL3_9BURK|nr:HprK-related kinase A [Noviherbaspirillum humi]SNS81248.1 Hpr(Ser) kinase/phosphatase [Noviherbaspirillum humi]